MLGTNQHGTNQHPTAEVVHPHGRHRHPVGKVQPLGQQQLRLGKEDVDKDHKIIQFGTTISIF